MEYVIASSAPHLTQAIETLLDLLQDPLPGPASAPTESSWFIPGFTSSDFTSSEMNNSPLSLHITNMYTFGLPRFRLEFLEFFAVW